MHLKVTKVSILLSLLNPSVLTSGYSKKDHKHSKQGHQKHDRPSSSQSHHNHDQHEQISFHESKRSQYHKAKQHDRHDLSRRPFESKSDSESVEMEIDNGGKLLRKVKERPVHGSSSYRVFDIFYSLNH